jgi:hypothetical protein
LLRTENRTDSGSYRIPIAIQFLWALILGTGLTGLPESPCWYVKKGRAHAVARSLSRTRGQPGDSTYIQEEPAEILANNGYEQEMIPPPTTSILGSSASPAVYATQALLSDAPSSVPLSR